jgi:hypothetical protein
MKYKIMLFIGLIYLFTANSDAVLSNPYSSILTLFVGIAAITSMIVLALRWSETWDD